VIENIKIEGEGRGRSFADVDKSVRSYHAYMQSSDLIFFGGVILIPLIINKLPRRILFMMSPTFLFDTYT